MNPVFEVRESRAWVRTLTHTVICEQDPDYARFAASGDGYVQRVLRVWLVEPSGPHRLRSYLGSVTLSMACLRLRDLRRMFRRAEQLTSGDECARDVVRSCLRHRLHEAARMRQSVTS